MISVIVVNYNGEKWLGECLNSILGLDFCSEKYEIIVVDNNSPDESWKIAEKYDGVKLIKNKKNSGFSGGNNLGIRSAKGDFIVLFNNDLIVDKNWIKETLSVMKKDKKVGVIGGKIYYGETKDVWFGGAKIYYGGLVSHSHLMNKFGESDYIVGAAVMFRKEVLDEVGLFNEKFYLYSEDIDLCRRIKWMGYKILYLPKAISYHMIKKDRVSSCQEYYEQRNRVYLYTKNYNFFGKILFLFLDICFLFPFFWFLRLKGNKKRLKYWKETLKARVDSIKMVFRNG